MKELNKKGFTLIELLAVIVIMGLLMMVAIPAVSKYISNSRKNVYVDTIKEYINAIDTNYSADELSCSGATGNYYISFGEAETLLKSGGDSPYGGKITGYIAMNIGDDEKISYKVYANDNKGYGFEGSAQGKFNIGKTSHSWTNVTADVTTNEIDNTTYNHCKINP